MPVPVPRNPKSVAHPVFKYPQRRHPGHSDSPVPPAPTSTLSVSPRAPPPPLFGTREEWVGAPPSWDKSMPRRIWEDDSRIVTISAEQHFQEGLIVARDASVIKGNKRTQACIPPLFTMLEADRRVANSATNVYEDADDELSSESSILDNSPFDNQSQWSACSPLGSMGDIDLETRSQVDDTEDCRAYIDCSDTLEPAYDLSNTAPGFEDDSPNHNAGSSPIGPTTPFGEFVDRAVATSDVPRISDREVKSIGAPQSLEPARLPKEPSLPEPIVTPSASAAYKKLAEALSEWIANYIWKVCATGTSLPSTFANVYVPSFHPRSQRLISKYLTRGDALRQRPASPPSYLAGAIHSLLLSTLLQPSVIFLAVWYIVRLPVYFDGGNSDAQGVKEMLFRAELLGEASTGLDREVMEANAPFHLVVLGCMLANKWLDDHTFSNKTWHTISGIPIRSINKLESLALDIFLYDLSMPSTTWSQWLSHILAYHLSLSPPFHRQPISRPSCNPHSIIRKAIEELVHAPVCSASSAGSKPEPVFLGLEERRREKERLSYLDIDLDAGGPLREEYLPRRRASGISSVFSASSSSYVTRDKRFQIDEKQLPPPAKWSPAGDEPILRDKNGSTGNYLAVQPQPISASAVPRSLETFPYQHTSRGSDQGWPMTDRYLRAEEPGGRISNTTILSRGDVYPSHATSHVRSQSLSYGRENVQPLDRHRPFFQSYFQCKCSVTTNEPAPAPQWPGRVPYASRLSQIQPLGPYLGTSHQSTWLRI